MKKMVIIAMVALGAMGAQAALVMDLSGNFNTGTARPTVALPTMTQVDANTRFYSNGFATPYVVNGAAVTGGNYVGPTLYASWRQSNVGGITVDPTRRIASTDYLENTAGASTVANASGTFNFMYMVKKANFANGLNTGNVGFDATSDFSIAVTTWSGISKSLRAVVQNGSTWYISQSENTASGSNEAKTLANAASMRWSIWNPTTSADFSGDSLNFSTTVAGSTFTDIQAVGVWGRIVDGATNPNLSITTIQIGAVAVPEPATVGMLGLGAIVTLMIRRMRR